MPGTGTSMDRHGRRLEYPVSARTRRQKTTAYRSGVPESARTALRGGVSAAATSWSDRGVTVTTKDGVLFPSDAGTWVTDTAKFGVTLALATGDTLPRSAAFAFAPPCQ